MLQVTYEADNLERIQAVEDYRWLLSHDSGKRIALTILRLSQVDATGPVGGGEEMAIFVGGRRVGNIFRDLFARLAPDQWAQLQAEQIRQLADQDEKAWRAAGVAAQNQERESL